jgi:hypothetical protein
MPLMKYFGFVGSALLLLLVGLNWLLPQAASEPARTEADRAIIRITSAEKLPERVDIDTSLPTIVPSRTFTDSSPEVEAFAPSKGQVVEEEPSPKPMNAISHDVGLTVKKPTKRKPLNILAELPSATPASRQFLSSNAKQSGTTGTRMSLLDMIKERFGRGFFRLN